MEIVQVKLEGEIANILFCLDKGIFVKVKGLYNERLDVKPRICLDIGNEVFPGVKGGKFRSTNHGLHPDTRSKLIVLY